MNEPWLPPSQAPCPVPLLSSTFPLHSKDQPIHHTHPLQRVLLLDHDRASGRIRLRQYSIVVQPSGVTKNLKALLGRRAVPDLGECKDVSEFLTRSGYGSESEGDDPDTTRVELAEDLGKGNQKARQSRIRLHEVGGFVCVWGGGSAIMEGGEGWKGGGVRQLDRCPRLRRCTAWQSGISNPGWEQLRIYSFMYALLTTTMPPPQLSFRSGRGWRWS